MIPEIAERLTEFVAPSLLLVGALCVIGEAVRCLVGRWIQIPRGLAPLAALGCVVVGLFVSWAFFLRVPVKPVAWVCVAGATVVVVFYWLRSWRQADRPMTAWSLAGPSVRRWFAVDAAAALVATTVLGPVLVHGATFWTGWANDFPSYVAYAQAWMAPGDGVGSYLSQHPDPFGEFMAANSRLDKLGVTANLVLAEVVTLTPVFKLLTPTVWIILTLTISLTTRVIFSLSRVRLSTAFLLAMLPSLSVVPLTRILENQLGTGFLVVFCLLAISLLALQSSQQLADHWLAICILLSVLLSACLFVSYVTFLAFTPVFMSILVLMLLSAKVTAKRIMRMLFVLIPMVIGLSIPLIEGFLESISRNLSGNIGQAMDFPSPLALFGQQVSVNGALSQTQSLQLWLIGLVAGAIVLLGSPLGKRTKTLISVGLVMTIANFGLILSQVDIRNYATHKWMSLFISVGMPVALAALVKPNFAGRLIAHRGLSVVLATSTLIVAFVTCMKIPFVVPRDLVALESNVSLENIDAVNVELGNYYEDAFAASLLPTRQIVVVGPTYAAGGEPKGSWFLTRRGEESECGGAVHPLNATYQLVHLGLTGCSNESDDG